MPINLKNLISIYLVNILFLRHTANSRWLINRFIA